jgi:hypothetical protein
VKGAALAFTLRASETDFSLPQPTLQAISPGTNNAGKPSRGKPQSATFSARLTCEAGRSGCEQRESGAKGEERTPDDPRLVRSSEDAEDEHEAKREPGGNRSEDDEPDVALRRDLLSRAEAGAR